ncbi:3-deoxy-manno-octulosonate cytidylyltransferase [Novipirellula aureliae]|uniref:3-deoxy-manno-octulosonate cytidylyltransferase n=2 Tax=Novipirellula aureliae TaxID=2527966 RepID=A0A5C6E857_9BACT|nr:3-deoxy-manno-octulosonate cytidylyltransferase [Novipirellula aureliae]
MIVIPARLGSTRFSEKLLRRAGNKSVLQYTFEAAKLAKAAEQVVIAVDDAKLFEEASRFGGHAVMTSVDCPSGTDRIAEVANTFPDIGIFVNVQGDEPEIDPATIDLVTRTLIHNPWADIATVAAPIREADRLDDPNCVKVVVAGVPKSADQADELRPADAIANGTGQGRAVYFSRSSVPHLRGGVTEQALTSEPPLFWHHLGLYAYRREFLQWFSNQPPSVLEQTERLEQLRAIEAGKQIVIARVESAVAGIDTQEDFEAFKKRVRA